MHKISLHKAWPFLIGAVCGAGLCAALGTALAQQAQPPSADVTSADQVRKLLRDFVAAVEKNDVEAALKLFATEADLKVMYPAEAAQRSANELRSHIKLTFHEFPEALKEFGKHDLVEVNPGTPRVMTKGEMGLLQDAVAYERGYVSFARDCNYFIELRFNIGGILRVKTDKEERFVFTNMETRVARFQYIQPEKGG